MKKTSSRCKRKNDFKKSHAVWGKLRAPPPPPPQKKKLSEENLKAGYHTLTQYLYKK